MQALARPVRLRQRGSPGAGRHVQRSCSPAPVLGPPAIVSLSRGRVGVAGQLGDPGQVRGRAV